MTHLREKRSCRRFEVPGARVSVKRAGLLGLLTPFSRAIPVVNLSKGGLAFAAKRTFTPDTQLLLRLTVPGEGPLRLRCRVRWQGPLSYHGDLPTGVEFAPFGERRDWNPRKILDALRRLDVTYGEDA